MHEYTGQLSAKQQYEAARHFQRRQRGIQPTRWALGLVAGLQAERWLGECVEQFAAATSCIDNLKRQQEEMKPRYYRYNIPFHFGLISQVCTHCWLSCEAEYRQVEIGCLLFAKAHMLAVLSLVSSDPSSSLWSSWLKRSFEFAFKVQQWTKSTDTEATELLEMVFEKLQESHDSTMEQLKNGPLLGGGSSTPRHGAVSAPPRRSDGRARAQSTLSTRGLTTINE